MIKKLLLCSFFLFNAFAVKADNNNYLPPEVMASAVAGVNAIYALDYKTAREEIDKVLKAYPDYPIALFGRTMIEWSRFEYEFEKSNPAQAKVFEESINSSIEGIKNWLEQNKPDAQAYLALGALYGVKGRFQLANRHFIKAYFSGRKGIKYMNLAVKMDPQLYDAYIGEAIYQYYAGTLPAVIKILAKIVVSGNAQKGIDLLNMIKDKGRFSADSAKLLLIEIAIENDKYRNPALAKQYIDEIIIKYPNNPLFRFVAIIANYENGQYEEVLFGGQDFLTKIGKEPFYNDIYIARAHTAVGTAYMGLKDYKKAAEVFEQSVAATKQQPMSRWQMWNLLRLAQTYDALGRTEDAKTVYREIISSKENWGIDETASKYLKHPFADGQDLGRMSPP